MNTKEMTQEQISAFADGELAMEHADVVLAALRRPAGAADWEIYHQLGDVLRSDDMDVNLSSDFAARMAARLDMEPTIIAPAVAEMPLSDRSDSDTKRTSEGAEVRASGMTTSQRPFRRWAKPGMIAAAAVASVAFFTTPQLMVALKGEPAGASTPAIVSVGGSASSPETVQTGAQSAVVSSVPEGVVLRDPRIDEYLLAHQRFSPSVYSTAQYARSATFANDSKK